MTDLDYQLERDLRTLTKTEGSQETAHVLADFYEMHGQPSRARLWRETRLISRHRPPADFLVRDPIWRRKVMMWLLGNIQSQAAVARAFKSSASWTRVLIDQVKTKICEAANAERHHPTMSATLRLQAAGALPPSFEPGPFELGDVPPDEWPVT